MNTYLPPVNHRTSQTEQASARCTLYKSLEEDAAHHQATEQPQQQNIYLFPRNNVGKLPPIRKPKKNAWFRTKYNKHGADNIVNVQTGSPTYVKGRRHHPTSVSTPHSHTSLVSSPTPFSRERQGRDLADVLGVSGLQSEASDELGINRLRTKGPWPTYSSHAADIVRSQTLVDVSCSQVSTLLYSSKVITSYTACKSSNNEHYRLDTPKVTAYLSPLTVSTPLQTRFNKNTSLIKGAIPFKDTNYDYTFNEARCSCGYTHGLQPLDVQGVPVGGFPLWEWLLNMDHVVRILDSVQDPLCVRGQRLVLPDPEDDSQRTPRTRKPLKVQLELTLKALIYLYKT